MCLAILLPLTLQTINAGKPEPVTATLKKLELSRVNVIPIQESNSKRQYELYIKLPEDYSKNNKDKTFPVIYFTDALWAIEMLSSSTEYIMEDVILVGISWQKNIDEGLDANSGEHVSRYRDFTFIESNKPELQAKFKPGQAGNHVEFIKRDVIHYVEQNYRADSTNRTYFGYSAGAEFGAYILLTQKDLFKNYILGSPSVTADSLEYLSNLKFNATLEAKPLKNKVFISRGSLEEKPSVHINSLVDMLNTRSMANSDITYEIIDGTHKTAYPMTAVRSVIWLSEQKI